MLLCTILANHRWSCWSHWSNYKWHGLSNTSGSRKRTTSRTTYRLSTSFCSGASAPKHHRTPTPCVSQHMHAVEAVSRIGNGERGLIPVRMNLCLVLLVWYDKLWKWVEPDEFPRRTDYHTTPAASAERSFSTLRHLKSYLRCSISQERVNHLKVLDTYNHRIDKLDEVFCWKPLYCVFNDMRRRTFALPNEFIMLAYECRIWIMDQHVGLLHGRPQKFSRDGILGGSDIWNWWHRT